MTSVLDVPVRVDRRGEHLYFFNGAVCVDVQSGTQEQRKAVLDLLAQVQAMALAALQMKQCPDQRTKGGQMARERMDKALRDAGVMSDRPLESEDV